MSAVVEKVKRYPLVVAASGVTLLLVGAFFLRGNAVPGLEIREAELTDKVQVIESNAQNATGLSEHLEAVEQLAGSIDEKLFDREEVAMNTNFFYDLDDDLGVQIIEVTQRPVPPNADKNPGKGLKQYSVIIFEMEAVGSFQEIVELLHVINNVDAFVRVSDFQLKDESGAIAEDKRITTVMKIEVLGMIES